MCKRRVIILIDGRHYDATDLKHPGGSIIRFFNSATEPVDATSAFREFHARSSSARIVLASLPRVSMPIEHVDGRHEALTRDFVSLRRELEAEGAFEPSLVHIALRCTELVALIAVSFWLVSCQAVPAVAAGVLINGIAQGRCGWLMHEGGHSSLTCIPSVDRRIQEAVYGIGCGMSASWWRSHHNKHHAATQKLDHDVDLDTLPLLAFNRRIAERAAPGTRWLLSAQAYMFAPLLCLLIGLVWSLYLHPRHILRTRRVFEAACCAARYAGWLALMHQLGYSSIGAMWMYMPCFAVGCAYTFVNFAVSHTHLPGTEADVHLHWVEYSALHTTNVGTGSALVTWWMCYLNFQIEHHLFPTMPQFRCPRITPRVRRLLERHGLPYDHRPYATALRDTFANLRAVSQSVRPA